MSDFIPPYARGNQAPLGDANPPDWAGVEPVTLPAYRAQGLEPENPSRETPVRAIALPQPQSAAADLPSYTATALSPTPQKTPVGPPRAGRTVLSVANRIVTLIFTLAILGVLGYASYLGFQANEHVFKMAAIVTGSVIGFFSLIYYLFMLSAGITYRDFDEAIEVILIGTRVPVTVEEKRRWNAEKLLVADCDVPASLRAQVERHKLLCNLAWQVFILAFTAGFYYLLNRYAPGIGSGFAGFGAGLCAIPLLLRTIDFPRQIAKGNAVKNETIRGSRVEIYQEIVTKDPTLRVP